MSKLGSHWQVPARGLCSSALHLPPLFASSTLLETRRPIQIALSKSYGVRSRNAFTC